jgi:uncharacterized protein with PQ loop repeat
MIGWIGAVAFGLCGLPQSIKAYRDGHAEGLDWGFLGLWTLGEICTLVAVLKDAPEPYLIANYVANMGFLAIMWRYKLKPRKSPWK